MSHIFANNARAGNFPPDLSRYLVNSHLDDLSCKASSTMDQMCIVAVVQELNRRKAEAEAKVKAEAELAAKIAAEIQAKAKADREADLDSKIKSLHDDGSEETWFIQQELQTKGFSLNEIDARLEALHFLYNTAISDTPITDTSDIQTKPQENEIKVGGKIEEVIDSQYYN